MVRRNPEEARDLRKATIFADAVLAVLRAPAASVNGRLALDEDFLRSDAGVTDFAPYAVVSPPLSSRSLAGVHRRVLYFRHAPARGQRGGPSPGTIQRNGAILTPALYRCQALSRAASCPHACRT